MTKKGRERISASMKKRWHEAKVNGKNYLGRELKVPPPPPRSSVWCYCPLCGKKNDA